jgi:hypothetical protein
VAWTKDQCTQLSSEVNYFPEGIYVKSRECLLYMYVQNNESNLEGGLLIQYSSSVTMVDTMSLIWQIFIQNFSHND